MSTPDPVVTRMRTIRQHLGWSLEWAAQKTGVSTPALGSWERGERHPHLGRIMHVLGVYGYRLAVVGPDERVVSTKDGGEEQLAYVVLYGPNLDGVIDCNSEVEAFDISHHMPASRVGYRVNRRGAVQLLGPGGVS